MLDLIDRGLVRWRVVQQDFHAVGPSGDDPPHGIVIQQVGETSRSRVVVPASFVGQQKAGIFRAHLRRGQPVLRIEQNGARVRREDAAHRLLELTHHLRRHFLLVHAFFFGDGAQQRTALIHGRRRDDSARVRNRLQALLLPRADFHAFLRPLRFVTDISSHSWLAQIPSVIVSPVILAHSF